MALGQRAPVAGGIDLDLPGADVRLRGTQWPGTGVPVLLLHGLASTRRFWDLVVPRLAGLPLLALDQRGHGDSERPAGPYDGATVARDALTALDALGLSRVVVVGHSWGASTALRLAADAPERVLAAVAIDGGFGSPSTAGADRAQVRARLEPPRTALPVAQLRERLATGPLAPWWSPAVEAAVLPIFQEGPDGLARARLPFDRHMAIVDDLLDSEPAALLPRIGCPVWLVSAEPAEGAGAQLPESGPQESGPQESGPQESGPQESGPQESGPQESGRQEAVRRASALLARPRVLRWAGAVHDVPLQWPALVAGLVRAAVEEVSP